MLQLKVRLGYRVVADDKLLGKRANAWHNIAVLQDAGFNCMTDLLHELKVKRMARGRIDSEDHEMDCTTVLVQLVNLKITFLAPHAGLNASLSCLEQSTPSLRKRGHRSRWQPN